MVFSSIMFLFRFLPAFMILYFCAPGRTKNLVLLLGSLVFYAWGEPIYVLLMLFSTLSDYLLGRWIDAKRGTPAARWLLGGSIVINLGLLGFFKYADFIIQTVNTLFHCRIPLLQLGLPIGISFYTFQTMSYTIDVYRGDARVQKNLLDFAVFVTMFPQLIAGPIVKYRQVEDSLYSRKPDLQSISYGIRRFIVGLAKKVLLANNLGLLWVTVKAMDYTRMSVLMAWLGIFAFGLQIYYDFSGYSDMAIGLGAVLGFRFPENFNHPYISATITEFWRRWHISLGSWFKEYVYIPLGGNRKGVARQIVNILIVWMLTGIWHGAGWNFLCWGLWFAFFLILEKLFLKKFMSRLPKMIGIFYTMAVVLVGWVFFELESTQAMGQYLQAMWGGGTHMLWDHAALFMARENLILLLIAVVASTPLISGWISQLKDSQMGYGIALRELSGKLFLPILLFLSIAYIVEASYNPFLYFRF